MARTGNPNLPHSDKTPRQGANTALADALHNDIDPQRTRVRERPVDRQMQELAVQGYTHKEIARTLGVTTNTVSNTLRQPWAREHMIERMQRSANEEIRALLEGAAPGSVKRTIELAEKNAGTELGFKADKEIMDRFMGKSVQPLSREAKDMEKLSDEELEAIAAGALVAPGEDAPK